MDRNIVAALVEMAIFLEFTGEDQLDPDASIQALEQLGATLQAAPDGVKRELVEGIALIAGNYGDAADFVSELPVNLGLV